MCKVSTFLKEISIKEGVKGMGLDAFSTFTESFEEIPQNDFPKGCMLRVDNENPYQSRSAGIAFYRKLNRHNGILILGEKTGQLSAHLLGREFRKVILFFPKEENLVEELRRTDIYNTISDKVVAIVDLTPSVHLGPATVHL